MNLFLPKHFTILVQALDLYRREQTRVLEKMDPSSEEYENHNEFLLQVDLTLGEVERGYEELRKEYPTMIPYQELLREGA